MKATRRTSKSLRAKAEFVKHIATAKPRISGFKQDELCTCMTCGLEDIAYREFQKDGKHFNHACFPNNAWIFSV